jgi:carbonic anhydrase
MDGRVPLEAAFDQDIGAVVAIRSAAHALDQAVLGSLDLAVTLLRVDAVLVLGHTDCAAAQQAMDAARSGRRGSGPAGHVLEQIAPAVQDAGDGATLQDVVEANVRRVVARLRRVVPLPHDDPAAIVGGVYHLESGRVTMLD